MKAGFENFGKYFEISRNHITYRKYKTYNLQIWHGGIGVLNIYGIRHVWPIRVCFSNIKKPCKGVSFLKNRVKVLFLSKIP